MHGLEGARVGAGQFHGGGLFQVGAAQLDPTAHADVIQHLQEPFELVALQRQAPLMRGVFEESLRGQE